MISVTFLYYAEKHGPHKNAVMLVTDSIDKGGKSITCSLEGWIVSILKVWLAFIKVETARQKSH